MRVRIPIAVWCIYECDSKSKNCSDWVGVFMVVAQYKVFNVMKQYKLQHLRFNQFSVQLGFPYLFFLLSLLQFSSRFHSLEKYSYFRNQAWFSESFYSHHFIPVLVLVRTKLLCKAILPCPFSSGYS